MSASLIVLIPVVLLGVVTALCFVGCGLNTHGYGFGPYEDPISKTQGLVSCWPLDDQSPPNATDIGPGQFTGTYTGNNTGPTPDFSLQQPGIVPGDTGNNGPTPCALFTGGFVQVGFQQMLNQGQFTLEAWVKPNWTPADPQVQRAVMVSANSAPNVNSGFALIATPDNFWAINLGVGTSFKVIKADQPITFGFATYLAVTFDGMKLTLYVTVVDSPNNMPIPKPLMLAQNENFVPVQMPNTTPLFIGMGRPDTPNGMFPFNGWIQDVAYYGVPLSGTVIQAHFALGIPG